MEVQFPLRWPRSKGYSTPASRRLTGAYQVIYAFRHNPAGGQCPFCRPTAHTGVSTMTNITATFSEAMDPATINTGTFELRDPSNNLVPATVDYDATTLVPQLLTPTDPLANFDCYSATIKGGANGVKDVAGNPVANDFTWSFTTAAVSTGPYSIWPSTTVPGVVDSGPDRRSGAGGEVPLRYQRLHHRHPLLQGERQYRHPYRKSLD